MLVTGVAIGVFVPRGQQQPPAAPTASAPHVSQPTPPPDEPVGRVVGAEIHLPTETAQDPPAPGSTPGAPTPAADPAVGHHPPGAAPAHVGGAAPPPSTHTNLSTAQLALLNTQLGTQSNGVAESRGPTNTQLRGPSSDESAGGGLTGQARAGQVIEAFRRNNTVDSCWTAAQRRNPAHPGESIRVQLDVLPNGRASGVRVIGAQDPDLSTCIQTRARGNPYGVGGTITAEMSFNLVSGQ